jgi:hypothetical protein
LNGRATARGAHAAAWLLVVCAAGCGRETAEQPPHLRDPFAEVPRQPDSVVFPPRQRTTRAGLAALRAEFTRADAGGTVRAIHSWSFPDRWRLEERPSTGGPAEHRFVHRSGAETWVREPRSARSRPVEPHELEALTVEDELRLAALLWPDGDSWSVEGDGASTVQGAVPGTDGRTSRTLVAVLGDDGLPVAIESPTDGARLGLSDWHERHGRSVPRRFAFALAGHTWEEELVRFEPCDPFAETFFVPVEVARERAGRDQDVPAWRDLGALPRRAVRREAVEPPVALADARALGTTRLAELGDDGVQAEALFEVARDGRVVALLLRATDAGPVPAGFELSPAGLFGLALVVSDGEPTTLAAAHERLRRALPTDRRPEAAYLWSGGGELQLVLQSRASDDEP